MNLLGDTEHSNEEAEQLGGPARRADKRAGESLVVHRVSLGARSMNSSSRSAAPRRRAD